MQWPRGLYQGPLFLLSFEAFYVMRIAGHPFPALGRIEGTLWRYAASQSYVLRLRSRPCRSGHPDHRRRGVPVSDTNAHWPHGLRRHSRKSQRFASPFRV